MPLDKYFKGKGATVMANMAKEYGAKKGKRIFYATANARKMTPPVSHMPKGFPQTPAGDLGTRRQKENGSVKGFTGGSYKPASAYFKPFKGVLHG